MSDQWWLYLVTALVSVAIALFLAHLAKRSDQSRMNAEKKKIDELIKNSSADAALEQVIFEEVGTLGASPQQSHILSKKLFDVVSTEMNRRVTRQTTDLTQKYESALELKVKSEELAWDKFERTLSEKKQADAVIRSVAEGLVVVDAKGKVIMMNPAAEKLIGIPKKDKIGRGIFENLKDEHLVTLSHESKNPAEREIEVVSQLDETKRTVRASSAVIENENGQTIGMVSVLSDITKQKELDNLKAQFVANVSHELRTPLVAIDKSIGLILSGTAGEVSATQGQFLAIAERNVKRLTRLVNDLLDLAKLEAGKMDVSPELNSIEEVILESVEGFKTWAQTKSVTMQTEIEPGLPQAMIDPQRLIQVLNNLIGNAIKFTPLGGMITTAARFLRSERLLEVSVADTGMGIPEEYLPRVFDKFYQVGERISTDIGGTGIGLSIAREIVESHGGKIWVESEKGVGAKFVFSLPVPA